jgi:hypothetical protein
MIDFRQLQDGLSGPAARRLGVELLTLGAFGLIVGLLGPWGSDRLPWPVRHGYWMATIVGGGLIGVALAETLGRRVAPAWLSVLAVSAGMTPLVALYVLCVQRLMLQPYWGLHGYPRLLTQVFPIALAVMTVRALVWRRPRIETRTVVEPPLPQAEAAFRRRLSAKRRGARLIAVEAHDHYLRVHTDAGSELITLRFADALEELSRAHGWRTHRSWWVAAGAVEAVAWRRGAGEARLAGGLTAPVSRGFAAVLKEAGWR